MINRRTSTIGISAAALLLTTACSTLDTDTPDADDAAPAGLEALEIVPEQEGGYDRDDWPHWSATGNGCTSREQVLLDNEESGAVTSDDCGGKMTGEWVSWYDGETITDSSLVDMDHVVPLSEAAKSGGNDWDRDRREAFANDAENLIPSSRAENREKGDSDPAEWMPEDESVWCDYIDQWIEIKLKYDLAVDRAEHRALESQGSDC
ncbi:HNH endonuclease family protein [Salininema proteolyticum]|uniref:HNH endonuclease family protein n=1 Tax=Salininema proteolyticum TaxID=1607685 RepID=A0ABV8U1K2_9ACTN